MEIGGAALDRARAAGPSFLRTLEWLADCLLDHRVSPRRYESRTLVPRAAYLFDGGGRRRCTGPHEWNIPAAGDTVLYCGCCSFTRPFGSLPAVDLLSPRASASRWFSPEFARGLEEARAALRRRRPRRR